MVTWETEITPRPVAEPPRLLAFLMVPFEVLRLRAEAKRKNRKH